MNKMAKKKITKSVTKKDKPVITPEMEVEIQKQVKAKTETDSINEMLEKGLKIRRPLFREGSYIYMKDGKIYNQTGRETIVGGRDINETDWVEFK